MVCREASDRRRVWSVKALEATVRMGIWLEGGPCSTSVKYTDRIEGVTETFDCASVKRTRVYNRGSKGPRKFNASVLGQL